MHPGRQGSQPQFRVDNKTDGSAGNIKDRWRGLKQKIKIGLICSFIYLAIGKIGMQKWNSSEKWIRPSFIGHDQLLIQAYRIARSSSIGSAAATPGSERGVRA
jgi:hypothetical protein